MKINRLRASFGKLNGDELKLAPGLNVIEAPNESGKSTWCAFIRAMLYGVNTAERDKAGYLSDKSHYRPWDGRPMEGEMDITVGGNDITVRRDSLGQFPMRRLKAHFTGTSTDIPGLQGADLGLSLTGMTEKVFDRTAMIRRSAIQVAGDPELEKRISSLVSSGDEQLSFSQADTLLRKWSRAIEYNHSGELPQLQAEKEAGEATMAKLQTLAVNVSHAEEHSANFRKRIEALQAQLEKLEEYDRQQRLLKAWEAADQADEAAAQVQALSETLIRGGQPTGRNDLNRLRMLYMNAAARQEDATSARDDRLIVQKLVRDAEAACSSSSLYPTSPDDIQKRAEDATAAKARLHKPIWRWALMPLAILVLIGAILLRKPVGFIVAGVVMVVCAALFFIVGNVYERNVHLLKKLLMGYDSPEALSAAAEEYAGLWEAIHLARSRLSEAEAAKKSADTACRKAIDDLSENAAILCPGCERADLPEAMDELERKLDEVEKARQQADALRFLSDSMGGRPAQKPVLPEKPSYDRATVEFNLRDAMRRLNEAERSENQLRGERRACGDPAVVGSRIREAQERIEVLTQRKEALDMAVSALRLADTELQSRFSPVLNKEAGRILAKLTGGTYSQLTFGSDFHAEAARDTDTTPRDALYLSTGTVDQVYLALRLAMCSVLQTDAEPCPIILDDALSSFDTERAKSALACFKELSSERQILLFTCQDRERRLLADDPQVNFITLKP